MAGKSERTGITLSPLFEMFPDDAAAIVRREKSANFDNVELR